jgi:membrane protease YdiL (CAAX protease family)
MSLRARLREPAILAFAILLTAALALGLGTLIAMPMADHEVAGPVLALTVQSVLWGAMALWVGTGLGVPKRVPGLLPLGVGVGLGTGAFAGFALWIASVRLPITDHLMPDPAALDPLWFTVLAAVALVLAPLGEEALFRGALFAGIRKDYGPGTAIVASALAFALVHLSPVHLVVAAVAGLALGWLREHSGRLWPCVVAHACHNALWLLTSGS